MEVGETPRLPNPAAKHAAIAKGDVPVCLSLHVSQEMRADRFDRFFHFG
jgi:hypothetical protein